MLYILRDPTSSYYFDVFILCNLWLIVIDQDLLCCNHELPVFK